MKTRWTYAAVAAGVVLLIAHLAMIYSPEITRWKIALFGREGLIIVNSPAVYTRQRLVNDRLSQTAWLTEQLKRTGTEIDEDFRGIDGIRIARETRGTSTGISVPGGTAAPSQGAGTGGTAPGAPSREAITESEDNRPQIDVVPTTAEIFRAMNAYRDDVRAEIMAAQLDDRHDILGNTIYRLGFDATVLAGTRADDLALINVTLRYEPDPEEYRTLYYDWVRYLQQDVDRSISALVQRILTRNNGPIGRDMVNVVVQAICREIVDQIKLPNRDCSDAKKAPEVSAAISAFANAYHETHGRVLKENFIRSLRYAEPSKIGEPIKPEIVEDAFARANMHCGMLFQKTFASFNGKILSTEFLEKQVTPALEDLQRKIEYRMQDGTELRYDCPAIVKNPDEDVIALGMFYLFLKSSQDRRSAVSLANLDPKGAQLFKASSQFLCGSRGEACWPELIESQARCIAALYYKNRLEQQSQRNPSQLLTNLVTFTIEGERSGDCYLRVGAEKPDDAMETKPADIVQPTLEVTETSALEATETSATKKCPGDVRSYLNNFCRRLSPAGSGPARVEVFAYSVGPRNMVQRIATASDVRDSVQLMIRNQAVTANVDTDSGRTNKDFKQLIQRYPVVVGFGSGLRKLGKSDSEKNQTNFGWVIAPQMIPGGGLEQVDSQYSLSSVISVPSWWRSAKLIVETCWRSRQDLSREMQFDGDGWLKVCTGKAAGPTMEEAIRLPGAIPELQRKLGFEVEEEPNISGPQLRHVLQVGKKASILIAGGRLWRSTIVTLGAQEANDIIVLPDMKGIIAKFKCVEPQSYNDPYVRVWTSEGQTQPLHVEIEKYLPDSNSVEPCSAESVRRVVPAPVPGSTPNPAAAASDAAAVAPKQ